MRETSKEVEKGQRPGGFKIPWWSAYDGVTKRQTSGGFRHEPFHKECHTGIVHLASSPDLYVGGSSHGARGVEWLEQHPGGLLIDLADNVDVGLASNYGFHLVPEHKVIKIDWRDWSACLLTRASWVVLTQEITRAGAALVMCMGGHGRTGTAAAILLTLMGRCNGCDAVKYVRDNYCTKAVESKKQLDYIDELCGFQIERSLSMGYGFRKGGAGVYAGVDYESSDGTLRHTQGDHTQDTDAWFKNWRERQEGGIEL